MTNLVIMHAPNHAPSFTRKVVANMIHFANDYRVDSIGLTEAYSGIRFFKPHNYWQLVVGRSRTDPRRGAKDVPILVHRRHKIEFRHAYKVCKAARPRKYNPERWITEVVYEHEFGHVAHIAVHPGPINNWVRNRWSRNRRAAKPANMGAFQQNTKRLDMAIAWHLRQGHLVVVTGDMNCRNVAHPERWMPNAIFAKHKLSAHFNGIDAIAHSPELELAHPMTVIPPSRQGRGQDHKWLIATLKRKAAK